MKVLATVITKAEKIKGIQTGKEEVEPSLHADDKIPYRENTKYSTKAYQN